MMATPYWSLLFLAFITHAILITGSLVRKNVDLLTDAEVLQLQTALKKLEDDTTSTGYQALAAYHGLPSSCSLNGKDVACCIHGMATFPQWHRLYVVQFEQLLVNHGLANIGVPYWDWTKPLTKLPELVRNQIFKDPQSGKGQHNSWFSGAITFNSKTTARALDNRLFQAVAAGEKSQLFEAVLDALEQDDYCQFEVQFEVAHNTIHYLVGGRNKYSLSTLEYSAYDPLFFLHHSNVDRLFAIWQELQKKRGKPFDRSDCNVELFNKDLEPFNKNSNPIALTRTQSKAKQLFSTFPLGYAYDDLNLNDMNIDQLFTFLEQRRARERALAVYTLTGIGISADVSVTVCENVEEDEVGRCENAGQFFILGGANEMQWEFNYPYYFDISQAVERLGQPLDGRFTVQTQVKSVNGSQLESNLHKPYAAHRPPKGYKDPVITLGQTPSAVVRKDIDDLTKAETYALLRAMSRFQNDTSIDGYQAVAEFHGAPAKCPTPDAAIRYSCCIHGMATFPHWHRLFVVEVEDELRARGLEIGVPYWDWTKPRTKLPALAELETYTDPNTNVVKANPFYSAPIAFLANGTITTRDIQPELTENPSFGDHTVLYDGMLLALEQTNFCDFEVQLEVVHNAIHGILGGYSLFSMASLDYSAFDPIFYLHHSNVDRLWAIWQKLQILRGLPYKAHCANSLTQEVLKPFGFPPPWNNDEKTFKNAIPTNIYDYEQVLNYQYDTLLFGGMSITQLEEYLQERQTKDRVFVGILLYGIQVSAYIKVSISVAGGDPYNVGSATILGGGSEMPWRFNRLYKLEITDSLKALGLSYTDNFEVHLVIKDINHNTIEESKFSHENIIFVPAKEPTVDIYAKAPRIRSDITSLTVEQIQNLRDSVQALQADAISNQIAAYHGQPKWCPSPSAEQKFACCAHGMAIFPPWHRLLIVQAENALVAKGLKGGLPYWDWTLPMNDLPDVVKMATYVNPQTNAEVPNPLNFGIVDGHTTTRNVSQSLFEQPRIDDFTNVATQVMLAFEQTNYCDFEVQLEVAHNLIHAAVGGNDEYSMASLRYTAYDPLFFLHHSNTDRLWAIWQKLQKYRGLPYNSANCALAELRRPLQPFAQTRAVNPDPVTRDHSVPFDVFDYGKNFNYEYDDLEFNGMSIAQLQRETIRRQSLERAFVGFMLHGIKQSALVRFQIVIPNGTKRVAGEFYLLGDEYEMPWQYDRLFKYEITEQLKNMNLQITDRYDIEYTVFALNNSVIGTDTFGKPVVIDSLGAGHVKKEEYFHEVQASSYVRRNVEDLNAGEIESLKNALQIMINDGSFESIAKFHGYPGLCEYDGRKVACCVHGSPVFPHWHRLYVEQVDNALLSHGSAVSLPYWDWTQPINKLPELASKSTYFNSRTRTVESNPFFSVKIPVENEYTTRDPQPELFDAKYFMDNVLLALEQRSFCDFEVQFEVIHNAVHSYVGGKGRYSMATLDYASFDPLFFLHHAQVDRIWAIWQALQRYRGRPFDQSDCALNVMATPLAPFNDPIQNEFDLTSKYSRPRDVFNYFEHFDYHYDTLNFNDWNIPQLEQVLKGRRSRDRLFAGFLLHNIRTSAVAEIYVCVATSFGNKNCGHRAGQFSILGGNYEMPFNFDRLYKYDISDAVRKLGLRLDNSADFDLLVKLKSYNGSYIDASILNKPSVIFEPGEDSVQNDIGRIERRLVRKNVRNLSPEEQRSLVLALRTLMDDSSADGFQSLAAFHALPPLCPSPDAPKRYACCVHGMATFPQWHRLYTVQFEDALRRHGATVGIPYWDSVVPNDDVPAFLNDPMFTDTQRSTAYDNPWFAAKIEFEKQDVVRGVNDEEISKTGPNGYDTWSWKQFIFALEQEDYCDFEVQLEVAHNAMHAWIGGSNTYSMANLHYASYDPAFIVHHSFVDKVFAIWQELQKLRGKDPNVVNCALELMQEPLRPFSFGAPYNLNPETERYSLPEDVFDYKNHLKYEYDSLELQGMDVTRLQDYIDKQQAKDRVFAGFMLHGIGQSAEARFYVCIVDGECSEAGYFYILGGSAEMPWRFDRAYKYEITDILNKLDLEAQDPFTINLAITDVTGVKLDASVFPTPSVILEVASRKTSLYHMAPNRIRRELSSLRERDFQSLMASLRDLQNDDSVDGYQSIAGFHGAPPKCPSIADARYACCVHGVPTFPHWHRLYAVEMEDALISHGASVALPYWDWTKPIKALPDLFTNETYYDVWRDEVVPNPFARCQIRDDGYTVRDPRPELTTLSRDGKHGVLFDKVLLALEQTDYCDFEVQYEVVHNAAHYLIGGYQQYSLSTLDYSSYDPIFFIHHAFVDKIWAVWQELQKRRGLSYNKAECAINYMNEKLHPFDWPEINPNTRTRDHAIPSTVFSYQDLDYAYDNLEIGGHSLDELEQLIKKQKSHPRIFAGFALQAIGTSADIEFFVCKTEQECIRAGGLFILGGPTEMPWKFDRLVKYDITDTLSDANIQPEDVFNTVAPFFLKYVITAVNGTKLPTSTVPAPNLIFVPAEGASLDATSYTAVGFNIRKDINTLTVAEIKNLRNALRIIQDGLSGFVSYNDVAKAHGYPPQCQLGDRKVACCQHGMPAFPQWHRLFTRQMEVALVRAGSKLGIPYWDWTTAFMELPALFTDEEDNPFLQGNIPDVNVNTTRAPVPQLFKDPEQGEESFFYRQILLAFQQTDYCDFEVQFEVTHNAIHSWVGGWSPYGMSSLEYTAYDPLFFIHHANVDRQFAIWQALQRYRGLDYNTANCNVQELKKPLEPFNHTDNPIPLTRQYSTPLAAFNYKQLGYQYDNLNFHSLTIPQLENLIQERKKEDHIYANFFLRGFSASADVEFELCDVGGDCNFAGTFAILGGPLEMPWSFDRLFKYEVTKVFKQMRLRPDSAYTFRVTIKGLNGTELSPTLIDPPSVSFVKGTDPTKYASVEEEDKDKPSSPDTLIRYEVSSLSLEQVSNLKNALYKLQNDGGPNGYEAIASFHGFPNLCPENSSAQYACCKHGMPAFPAWHRLLTVQFERALRDKGAVVGVPYWDWTRPAKALPSLFTDQYNNPFNTYRISFNGESVTRDVQAELFTHATESDLQSLFHQALTTLEESNYCDFEVQLEMLHNIIHALVGGKGKYSMATLGYSAFDPIFMVQHSAIDRIWKIWAELQKLRKKPYNFAVCARRSLFKPLEPFNYESVNTDPLTRANSLAIQAFDPDKYNYWYDTLRLNGYNVHELNTIIEEMRASSRLFAGFVLTGIKTSASINVDLIAPDGGDNVHVGSFYILGGEYELPWAYERIYKLEITEALSKFENYNFSLTNVRFPSFVITVTNYNGTVLDVKFPAPVMVKRAANNKKDLLVISLRKKNDLPPKIVVRKDTQVLFYAAEDGVVGLLRELGSYTSAARCAIPPGKANAYELDKAYDLDAGDYFFTSSDQSECLAGSMLQISVDED